MQNFSNLKLSSDRLVLRAMTLADSEAILTMYSHPEFMRYWSSAPWESITQAHEYVRRNQEQNAAGHVLCLGIFLASDQSFVGSCILFHFDAQNKRAELGYGITPSCWRKGYMQEAVTCLLNYGFENLGLHRIEADVDPRNLASIASLEKLGFEREGYLRERWIVAGEICDSVILGLLAKDFASQQKNMKS